MTKKSFKVSLKVFLASILLLFTYFPVMAQPKEEVETQLEELDKKQQELQQRLNSLRASKANVENYIEELDKEIGELNASIAINEEHLNEVTASLEETKGALADVKLKENIQYEAFKKRIKVIYEDGDVNYLEILFQSENMEKFLTSQEYASKLSDYDKNLLDSLKSIGEEITIYEAQLVIEKSEVEAVKSELEEQKASLDLIYGEKTKELNALNITLSEMSGNYEQVNKDKSDMQGVYEAILKAEQGGIPSSSGLVWPVPTVRSIISEYGPRQAPTAGASTFHRGVDIAGANGTPIISSASGVVVEVSYNSIRGNYVVIAHGNGLSTLYQHTNSIYVQVGQSVEQGEVLTTIGNTGISTGPHLHYEVWENGTPVNPRRHVNPDN